MRHYRKYNHLLDDRISDATPTTVLSYTVPNTSTIVVFKLKFLTYNVDEAKHDILTINQSYIIGNITPAGLAISPDSGFNISSSGNTIVPSMNYDQSTGVVTLVITNLGTYATEISCNWSYHLDIFTN